MNRLITNQILPCFLLFIVACSEVDQPDLLGTYRYHMGANELELPTHWEKIYGPRQTLFIFKDSTFEFITTDFRSFDCLIYQGKWTYNEEFISLRIKEVFNISNSETYLPKNHVFKYSILSDGSLQSNAGYIMEKLTEEEAELYVPPQHVSITPILKPPPIYVHRHDLVYDNQSLKDSELIQVENLVQAYIDSSFYIHEVHLDSTFQFYNVYSNEVGERFVDGLFVALDEDIRTKEQALELVCNDCRESKWSISINLDEMRIVSTVYY